MRFHRAPTVLLLTLTACSRPVADAARTPAPAARGERPNILFILSDDHAAHALSAYRPYLQYGARLPETPSLDRLAADGMLFANAFVTNSICGPSRATVLTGQYGHLNGVMVNGQPLHPTSVTFPALLRRAGYRTGLFGKWHLQVDPEGFDHYEILQGQGPYYNPALVSESDTVRREGYTTDIIVDRALAWLTGRESGVQDAGVQDAGVQGAGVQDAGGQDAGGQGGFLLMVQFNAPHRFWDPGPGELGLWRDTVMPEPATLWDRGEGRASPARSTEMLIGLDLFDRDLKLEAPADLTPAQRSAWDRAYDAENAGFLAERASLAPDDVVRWKYQRYIKDYLRTVRGMDRAVGRLLDALDRAGLADNTLVVYTSDQGFFLGDHGWFDKRWMYEESLRTPLLVRWPGVVEPGSVNRDLVMNLDLAETMLEAGGVDAPAGMQGESVVPLLRGETPTDWRDAIYYQYFEYPGWHMVRRQYGVRTHRYKLIRFYESDQWELYDLARDPEELRSVYDDPEYAEVRRRLETRLTELRARYAVPAEDPVPHEEFNPPPQYRRTQPDTAAGGVPMGGASF